MGFILDERPSDSPLVETVWRTENERRRSMNSMAVSRWEMVVTRQRGKTTLTVRGPETKPTPSVPVPVGAEFLGIVFKHGAFMPRLPTERLVDRAIDLPGASGKSFWLDGSAFEYPGFENADAFVGRLLRKGLLSFDGLVDAALRGEPYGPCARTARRHFLRATGLTPGALQQIDRARRAVALLKKGVPVLDTVHRAGYFDQPHLTRSLGRFIGQTPAEILRGVGRDDMSLLYKTDGAPHAIESPQRRSR